MEDNVEYGMLDLNDEAQVIEYEKGLFKVYSERSIEASYKYQLIDNDRLRPIIPYDNLEVYTIRESNKLVSASVVNLDVSKYSQLGHMNIDLQKITGVDIDKVCEGFGLFSLNTNISPFDIGSYFTISVFQKMKKRGYLEYYGSSDKKIARLYTKLYHFEKIDEFKIGEIEKYLLKVDLRKM